MSDRIGDWGLRIYCFGMLVFLFAPIVVLVLLSFTREAQLPISNMTLHWYRVLFSDAQLRSATKNSLIVAGATGCVSAVLGTLTAIGIVRHVPRLAGPVTAFVMLPVLIPILLVAISLLSFLTYVGVPLSLYTVTLGHVLITLPFVVLTVVARFGSIDVDLEEAGSVLGANRMRVFRDITLPLLAPAIISSAFLAATISFGEFIIAFYVDGPNQTLPLIIWGRMRTGVTPEINAASTTLMVVTTLVAAVSYAIALRWGSARTAQRWGPARATLPLMEELKTS